VKRITSNTLVDGADKFSGLIQFGSDMQPYFYTMVPVKQGNDMAGGVMIAIKLDRLLLALERMATANEITVRQVTNAVEAVITAATYR